MSTAKVYKPQGADRLVVGAGGSLDITHGGMLTIGPGAAAEIDGGVVIGAGGSLIIASGATLSAMPGALVELPGAAGGSAEPILPMLTPVNAAAAAGTLEFTEAVADGELVTIGDTIYEFDTDSSVAAGHVAVDVSGGATAANAVTALRAAITSNALSVVATQPGYDTLVNVAAKSRGLAGNSIVTTTTCVNASWEKPTLTGGADGTPGAKGAMCYDNNYLYVAVAANTMTDANWRSLSLGTIS